MERVPAKKCFRTDDRAAQQGELDLTSHERRVLHHLGADRDGPDGELVPWEQVSGECEEQGEKEKDDATTQLNSRGGL